MDIRDLMELKKETEAKLNELINYFESMTGCHADIETETHSNTNGNEDVILKLNVKLP